MIRPRVQEDWCRWRARGLLACALALSITGAVSARGECPTWLPDLRCDRSGRFEGFHKPIVGFALFEDPFITTGIYPYYAWHEFPGRSAFQGGELHDVSVQLRVALTDRLALIATKDGYVWNRPDNPLLDDTQGWLNLSGGLKAALFVDEEKEFILSSALRFEVPSGSKDTFQGHSDGMIIPSLSTAWGYRGAHLMAGFGAQVPFDQGQQSTSLFYHLYVDYNLMKRLAPFLQLSGMTWVTSGDGKIPVRLKGGAELPLRTVQNVLGTGRFEGADLVNLGSQGVSGLDLFTWAAGAHIPITERLTFSAAYERPFSHHKGIFKQRVTTGLALEY